MHVSLLDLLVCPSCRVSFDATVHIEVDGRVELGFLQCPRCAIVTPVLDGLVMFSEPLLHAGLASAPLLAEMALCLFGTESGFRAYRRDKRERGLIESYAAFAPFNESTRAIAPILPHAGTVLSVGDAILDTWNRTGYSGEWLAGRFPRQHVVSLWEGNSSVLGYRGFRHLLGSQQRAGNLDIVFCNLDKPLPFCDKAFGLIHAYDSLHRYGLYPFAGECLRVAREDAAILFPHLHLSNSQPEPYFERGCEQRHGHDYRAWLDQVTTNGKRRGWVFSEAALFNGPELAELTDDPDTMHYNGMAAILPNPPQTGLYTVGTRASPRFVVSPLFGIHTGRGKARIAGGLFAGSVGHLLERHPIYAARLPVESIDLTDSALLALLLAVVGLDEHSIGASLPQASTAVVSALRAMTNVELLRPAAISAAAHDLQRFHGNQLPIRDNGIFEEFWSRIAACEGVLLTLAEGDELSGNDLSVYAQSTVVQLRELGLAPGEWLSVDAHAHPLLLLSAIAAASSGFNVHLRSASTSMRHDSRLLLHMDGACEPSVTAGLPLGLSGTAPSLLSALASRETGNFIPSPDDAGLVEFDCADGTACCPLADLVDALESLSAQIENQLWLIQGRSQFGDLIACLAGWSKVEAVRILPAGTEVCA